jgi:hypothetical protein
MAFACLRVAQHQWIAQHFLQRDALVGQQGMSRRHRHHERIAPDRLGDDAIADFIGLSEPHVAQIIVQPLDLLRQRYLEQTYLDFRLLLSAQRQQSRQARRRDSVG